MIRQNEQAKWSQFVSFMHYTSNSSDSKNDNDYAITLRILQQMA